MAIDLTPDTPRNEVRLNIGDTDGNYISDATIDALLVVSDNNVVSASLRALDVIIAELAKLCDEVTDEVNVKWSQKYKHYKDLRASFLLNNSSVAGPRFHIGGTSKTKNAEFYNDPDTVKSPVRSGDSLDTEPFVVSGADRFYLEDD